MPEKKRKIDPELLDWFRGAYGSEYDEEDATDRWLLEERERELRARRDAKLEEMITAGASRIAAGTLRSGAK